MNSTETPRTVTITEELAFDLIQGDHAIAKDDLGNEFVVNGNDWPEWAVGWRPRGWNMTNAQWAAEVARIEKEQSEAPFSADNLPY